MPKPVVDQLEIVEIHEQNSDSSEVALGSREGSLQAVGEQGTIRQTGQWIVECQLLELPLEVLAFGDVATGQHQARHRAIVQKVVRDHLEFAPGSIRVAESEFSLHVCAGMVLSLRKKRPCRVLIVRMHKCEC